MNIHYELTTITSQVVAERALLDLDEAADLSGLHPQMIEEYSRGHLVTAVKNQQGALYFDQAGIFRLRQIAQLTEQQGVNIRLVRYITTLLDTLDTQDLELRELREKLR
jgi:DNA-binding transcriptional MerR regulator